MSIIVGFGPDTRTGSGLRLAAALAHSLDVTLVLCCVIHDSFESSSLRDTSGFDADWRREINALADDAIAEAKEQLPDDLKVEVVRRTGRSVPQILENEAERRGAQMLVVGSSDGVMGRIGLGSTSDRLVHSSRVPVALAPRGFDPSPEGIRRVVLAVDPTARDAALVPGVVDVLKTMNASLVVVTFAVRGGSRTAMSAFRDSGVYAQWRRDVQNTQRGIVTDVAGQCPDITAEAGSVIDGERWSTAVAAFDWQQGDLLVIGSSAHAALARVFLGSTAARILRHSPVPVLVLPRGPKRKTPKR